MLKEIKSKEFSNGKVYVLQTEDGFPLEVTDTFLPYYTKDCINEHVNELKNYHLGSREDRWMIGVSCMSGCPVHCQFCLNGETPILMSDFTYKKIKNIEKGDMVVGNILRQKVNENREDYATKLFKSTKVIETFKRMYTGDLYNIYLENGEVLKVTDEHPIAVTLGKEKRIKFRKAKDINVDDLLLGLKHDNIQNLDIRYEDAWKLGWVYGFIHGDGTYVKAINRDCYFWNVSQSYKYILDYLSDFLDYFDVSHSSILENKIKNQKEYLMNYIMKIGEDGSNKLNELVEKYSKDINYKKGFIAGFWDAEGLSFYNNSTARFCNTSIKNLETIQNYLDFDFFKSEIKLYDSNVSKDAKCKNMYILETSINRFAFNLIFRPLHEKKNFLDCEDKKFKFSKNVKVIKVEKEKVQNYPVYNFETDTHTYIANNIVVHNCATGQLKRCRNLTVDEIVGQIEFILSKNLSLHTEECKEFKINYTRMGEPALNWDNIQLAIKKIDKLLPNTKVHHYISTIGVKGTDFSWIKDNITLQLSLHSLDENRRDDLIPYKNKMSIEDLGRIRTKSNLKTTINMTLVDLEDFDINKLKSYFDPNYFFIKVSPINPNPISEGNKMGKGVIIAENLV